MAGILGAITAKTPSHAGVVIYRPDLSSFKTFNCQIFCNYPSRNLSLNRLLRMAQHDPQCKSPEIKEPAPKIQKLHQNGVSQVSQCPLSLLRVKKLSEKAVLPSRASPLSAGYDLSR